MSEQMSMFPEDHEAKYQAFVDKFKPKKTTDDCVTPENIYRVVSSWVAREYGVDPASFVRPFWPGGDYEAYDYPAGCVVVDNPPFSILARIRKFYQARDIRFFLFAPTLTMFSGGDLDMCYIPCGVQITYSNGANVNTSFVTNLGGDLIRTAPDLYRQIETENDRNEKARTRQLPKYVYPPHVLTAAAAYQFSHYGVDFRVARDQAAFIRKLDAMKAHGKDTGIFGGAFLLSETAAAERAAAERAAATVWELSDRERRIVETLSKSTPHSTLHTPRSDSPFDLENLLSLPEEATAP